jgi:adenosylmethionine-8-amino-7-oxononanoate aminotransferase
LRNLGDVIAICPPLVIEEAEIATLFSRLSDALADLQNELLASTSIGREVSA